MPFAFQARKTSQADAYAARVSGSNGSDTLLARLSRDSRIRLLAAIALGVFACIWLLGRLQHSSRSERLPHGTPGAVIVTTFDLAASASFKEMVKENRRVYAERHGYSTFFPNTTDYEIKAAPKSWSTIPALRHAMTLYPHTPLFFFLSATALIMRPQLSIESHIMESSRLESLMIPNQPIVPPDSVIRTFPNIKSGSVDFVLTQDDEGLAIDSMILRRGDWATYLLDAWFDPLYRSYNFQKAELHALEHLVQWHGTILAKLALIPQRLLNSHGSGAANGTYQDGDFVVNLKGCYKDPTRECEREMEPYISRWQAALDEGLWS